MSVMAIFQQSCGKRGKGHLVLVRAQWAPSLRVKPLQYAIEALIEGV
jgi:hypothetical protein